MAAQPIALARGLPREALAEHHRRRTVGPRVGDDLPACPRETLRWAPSEPIDEARQKWAESAAPPANEACFGRGEGKRG